jgi:hypothetical protein
MRSYLVEVYMPRSRARDARADARRVRDAATRLSERGMSIRHVRTTLLPDDETCFHLVEAASSEVVEEACREAGLRHVRIVAAVER